MAKVNNINVSVTYKKSLPNYESIQFHAGISVEVEESENHIAVYKTAWDEAGKQINEQLELFNDGRKSMKKGL